jgi:hypothetical protein
MGFTIYTPADDTDVADAIVLDLAEVDPCRPVFEHGDYSSLAKEW